MKRGLIITLITISIFIVIFFILFSNKDLESYKGTSINDENKITKIVKNLNLEYKSIVIDKIDTPYGIRILLNEELEYFEYEKNAYKLLYLINDIEFVTFMYDDFSYNVKKNITFNSIKDIDKYYSDSNFDRYEYLGTISNYKVFDKSMICVNEKQLIGSKDNYNYFVYCNNIENIYLVGNEEITLKYAIDNNIITIDDIRNLNIEIYEEEI